MLRTAAAAKTVAAAAGGEGPPAGGVRPGRLSTHGTVTAGCRPPGPRRRLDGHIWTARGLPDGADWIRRSSEG